MAGQVYTPFEEPILQSGMVGAPTSFEFSSVGSMQSNYNIPFAAGDLDLVGEATPPGRRQTPPWIPGGGGTPDKPGFENPLPDGVWVLTFFAALYACYLIRQQRRKTKSLTRE